MSTVQATNLKHGSSASNNIVLDASGNTTISGAVTISGNAVVTGTLQANGVTGTIYPLVQGTAVASTSGTAIGFTGIPSWARRITVMLSGVSTNGTSLVQIQIGAGSFATSGYLGSADNQAVSGGATAAFTAGLGLERVTAANYNREGIATFITLGSNSWVGTYIGSTDGVATVCFSSTRITLAGALDRIRVTTVNGTDLFDAGSINLLWE